MSKTKFKTESEGTSVKPKGGSVKLPNLLKSEAVRRQLSIVGRLSDWNRRSDSKTWILETSL